MSSTDTTPSFLRPSKIFKGSGTSSGEEGESEGCWLFWKVNRYAAAASYPEGNVDSLAGGSVATFLEKYLSSVDSGLLCEEGMSVLLSK
jgi:hypothetical protein